MQTRTFSAFRANAVRQATVEVRVGSKTGPFATDLVDGNGNPLENPFPLPSSGRVDFAAPDGTYWINITGPGFSVWEQAQFLDAQTVIDWQDNLEAALEAAIEAVAAKDAAEAAAVSTSADKAATENARDDAREALNEFVAESLILSARANPLHRRRPARVREQWVGADGRTGMYLDRDSMLMLVGLGFLRQPRRPSRYHGAFCDEDGRVGWWLDAGGVAHSVGVEIAETPAPATRRPSRYRTGMHSVDGITLLGITERGEVDLRLGERGRCLLADDFGAALDDGWRGNAERAFVREGTNVRIALMRDRDGGIFDAVQRKIGRWNTSVALVAPEVQVFVGQSNAGSGSGGESTDVPIIVENPYPQHLLAPARVSDGATFPEMYGNVEIGGNPVNQAAYTDLAPATYPKQYGLAPGLLSIQSRIAYDRARRRKSPAIGAVVSWRGDTGAGDFLPGAGFSLYENTINRTAKYRQLFPLYRLPSPVCRRVFWRQGENGPYPYGDVFEEIIEAYITGVQEALEQDSPPHFYFAQINQSSADNASGVELDQRQIAIDLYGQGVTCVGPMYQAEFWPQHVSGNVHIGSIGRLVIAEIEAVVADQVEAGTLFQPLGMEVAVSRTGAQVDVTFSGMPGKQQLLVDDDWVADPGTLGFRAYLGADNTPLAISSATVVGINVVRLVLISDPGGPVRVDYARNAGAENPLWSRGRGLIYTDSGIPTLFPEHGLPTTIRHYALRFSSTTNS